MREIPLSNGGFAVVDDEDFDRLVEQPWCQLKGYARGTRYDSDAGRWYAVLMHRLIMDAPTGVGVDHINGDKLDNRRENLRLVNRFESNWNTPAQKNRSSRYKGVSKRKRASTDIWDVYITHLEERTYLGAFRDEVEAALAYDAKALELRGEHARINFPSDGSPSASAEKACV